jgi:hypothetical protein
MRSVQSHKCDVYKVSQNSRIPNSECGREDPVELEKYLEKKIALPEENISTLILFNTEQPSYPQIFLLQGKAILQKIVLRLFSTIIYTINNNKH